MNITKVTFTGADNNINPNDLLEIQSEFPFVEWGILIASNPGRSRYPTFDYIEKLNGLRLNLALHICGAHSRNILSNGNIDIVFNFFQRYQLNFNFSRTAHNLENYSKLITAFPDKKFILQTNASNIDYINTIISNNNVNNTNILFDSSGGRGTEIQNIQEPYKNIYTGYSGGLNPDNVGDICDKILSHSNKSEVWIDMESGVRTDDKFDLDKVRKVLNIVNKKSAI